MNTRVWRVVLAAMAILVLRVAAARAQCGVMSLCQFGHVVQGPSAGGLLNLHGDCLICVIGDCHPGCNQTLLPDSARKALFVEVINLARVGDAAGVARFATKLPGIVVFNRARGSVQVRSCSGDAIVANLPLAEDGDVEVESIPAGTVVESATSTAPVPRAVTR